MTSKEVLVRVKDSMFKNKISQRIKDSQNIRRDEMNSLVPKKKESNDNFSNFKSLGRSQKANKRDDDNIISLVKINLFTTS